MSTEQVISGTFRTATSLLACAVGMWFFPTTALAVDIYGISVKSVGAQTGPLGVIKAPAAAGSNCPSGYMYIDLTLPSGRAMLNTLMLAKSLDKPVFIRFDASGPVGSATAGLCNIIAVIADEAAG